ncbi:MAG TPA: hypothetical protein V6C95_02640 [Coleofasciculaceae cyanobacterium]
MKHYCDEWIYEWCNENGWTDVVFEHSNYWAFPPGAVIPEPIPPDVLRLIKAEKGLSVSERGLSISAVIVAGIAAILSYILNCPMPLVLAFAFCAIAVGLLEDDDR